MKIKRKHILTQILFILIINPYITLSMEKKIIEKYSINFLKNNKDLRIISQDGTKCVIITRNTIQVFDLKEKKLIFEKEKRHIQKAILTSSGKYMMVKYFFNKIAIYNTKTRKCILKYNHETNIGPIYITKNGNFCLSVSNTLVAKIHNIKQKKLIFKKNLYTLMRRPEKTCISENGKHILTVGRDVITKILRRKGLIICDEKYNNIAISENGQFFAYTLQNTELSTATKNIKKIKSTVNIYEKIKKQFALLLLTYFHNYSINFLDFTPCNKIFLSGSTDGNIKIYDLDKKKLLHDFTIDDKLISIWPSQDYKEILSYNESEVIKKYKMPLLIPSADINFKQNLLNKTKNKKLSNLIIRH